jgi:5-methyltetrahydropteroyltriglutamate--homocysteine methyltransferase
MDWYRWRPWHRDQGLGDYLDQLRAKVAAINEATRGIPPEQVRVHVCHGNWPGPHNYDIELPEAIGALYELNAGTLVLELSNRRHRWEREVFRDQHPLRAGKILAAGVVDSSSMCVEHERTVADELIGLASITGSGRLMATPDCGFRTLLGLGAPPALAEMKLRALVEGTRIANEHIRQHGLGEAA